jgi:CheY-like chemotaxis protein
LAVKDNGIGMTLEQQKQIFEAYTQADKSIARRFGGTGLGMTITKEIIELMGGTITLRSESGKGTVFALTLPLESMKAKSPKQGSVDLVDKILEDSKPEPTNYSGLRILVADDNTTNHMVITSLLESLVGEIHLVSDGQQAIDVLKTTPIDIVLMDIHMPVMDGIEATLAIRGSSESWSDVLIIALTADPQYQQKRLCKNIGMDDALAKPVKLIELLGAIDNVLKIDAHPDGFVNPREVRKSA